MHKSFSIKNYRCFGNLTIEPLARVNLISGKNNVGKTALLEALFIFNRRHPIAGFATYSFRGLEDFRIDDELALEFFQDFDSEKTITFTGEYQNEEKQLLDITIQERDISHISDHNNQRVDNKTFSAMEVAMQEVSTPIQIVFKYSNVAGETLQELRAFAEGGDIRFDGITGVEKPKISLLLARERQNPRDIAQALSNLRRIREDEKVIETLQIIDSRLKNIEVLQRLDHPVVYCDLEGISELMPMPLMGEGMFRLLEIALIIAHTKDSIVLIDEIENGIHHSVMDKVWQAIGDLARESNVQIFATTHSMECIEAAHQAFVKSPTYDFHHHRLERIKGNIQAVTYSQKNLDVAFEMGWEMR
ncbi:AAA family ATPase [Anaerolineales bacterium HSG25]|nr:AAA family ATPase [Anaerolineales bacterium HSG25]